jgi:hypothetical protein
MVAWLGVVHVAMGTTLVAMRDQDLAALSDVIAVGTVGHIESVLLGHGRIMTRVTLAVETGVKGTVAGTSLVVTEAGGEVAGVRATVAGAPSYHVGERVVVFLRERADGSLRTTALALGKYTVEPDATGSLQATRTSPTREARDLATFVEALRPLVPRRTARLRDGRAGGAIEPPLLVRHVFAFNLARNDAGEASRWFEADCGDPVVYARAGFDAGAPEATSAAALEQALAAWTAVDGGSLVLAAGSTVPAAPSSIGGMPDGDNVVTFDDPFGEASDLVACTGVLAVGGFVSVAADEFPETVRTIGGERFAKIFEGDVVVNPGVVDCLGSGLGLAEVLAHEIGHAIGLAHSSENPAEPDPVKEDALMYFLAHNDGRGASIRSDDAAGLRAAYPAAALATSAIDQAACAIELGVLNVACFGEPLRLGPFRRVAKAATTVRKAAGASTATKQRRLLRKADKGLAKADKAIARLIGGACGAGMRDKVAAYRTRLAAITPAP